MSTPEPIDEHPAGRVEIRGGDRDEDFMPGQLPLFDVDENGLCTCCGEDPEESGHL